jgi:NADH-quinone oxidoreductase subunit A
MEHILLAPPVVFLLYLALAIGLSVFSKGVAAQGVDSPGKTKSYACGEDMPQNQGQPDYSEFFKFAFFFTIMHVVVLIVATDPSGISFMSILYLVATVLSLFMLFRR